MCTGREVNTVTGVQTVHVSFSGCKSDLISWACCRGGSKGATQYFCDLVDNGCVGAGGSTFDGEDATNKCDEVLGATYTLDSAAETLTIQMHDGAMQRRGAGMPGSADGTAAGGQQSCTAASSQPHLPDP